MAVSYPLISMACKNMYSPELLATMGNIACNIYSMPILLQTFMASLKNTGNYKDIFQNFFIDFAYCQTYMEFNLMSQQYLEFIYLFKFLCHPSHWKMTLASLQHQNKTVSIYTNV